MIIRGLDKRHAVWQVRCFTQKEADNKSSNPWREQGSYQKGNIWWVGLCFVGNQKWKWELETFQVERKACVVVSCDCTLGHIEGGKFGKMNYEDGHLVWDWVSRYRDMCGNCLDVGESCVRECDWTVRGQEVVLGTLGNHPWGMVWGGERTSSFQRQPKEKGVSATENNAEAEQGKERE